jgi:hypothetical protein
VGLNGSLHGFDKANARLVPLNGVFGNQNGGLGKQADYEMFCVHRLHFCERKSNDYFICYFI